MNTLEVAVYGMVTNTYGDAENMPKQLKEHVRSMFTIHYDELMTIIEVNKGKNKTAYGRLRKKFAELKAKFDAGEQLS